MSQLLVSEGGIVNIGTYFFNGFSRKPPCCFEKVEIEKNGAGWSSSLPLKTTFSNYSKVKVPSLALTYSEENFFSVAVVRCDTWAIQWVVQTENFLSGSSIESLALLGGDVVCGTYKKNKDKGFFIASRFDIARVDSRENRTSRSFVAKPHQMELAGVNVNALIALEPVSATSFVTLESNGVVRLHELSPKPSEENKYIQKSTVVTDALGKPNKDAALLTRITSSHTFVAVYTPEKVEFLSVENETLWEKPKCQKIPIQTEKDCKIVDVSFAGDFNLLLTLEKTSGKKSAHFYQFHTILPVSNNAVELTAMDKIAVPATPLRHAYNEMTNTSVVFCSTVPLKELEKLSLDEKVASVVRAEFSLEQGPFTSQDVSSVSWKKMENSFTNYQPTEEDMPEGMTGSDALHTGNRGHWTPLQLYYVLENLRGTSTERSFFSIKTSAATHTRLIKQWHNATVGVQKLLSDSSTAPLACVTPWNPRHLRRALRLLSSSELTHLLRTVEECLQTSKTTPYASHPSFTYQSVATAVVDLLLHIVTLSRQVGLVLEESQVATIVALLRASREAGHRLTRPIARIEAVLDSSLQQHALRSLFTQQSSLREEETLQELEENFTGKAREMNWTRQLHTRYPANTWAQYLAQDSDTHLATAEAAAAYLKEAQEFCRRTGRNEEILEVSTWETEGRQPCGDKALDAFERGLLCLEK
ncbi:hypothetical protein, conserved [Angomonas deanei]|uniref:Uncharacterized protein n=1 Tax=Angomonas deanei TaxID=59799 RepID=A0A7G2CPS8_9TRYP|nr:hypothetical protein, conserved [Angomonas deanei]